MKVFPVAVLLAGFLGLSLLSGSAQAEARASARQSTPPPPVLVCSTVNRLNVRSGPGTSYQVVAGLTYDQCVRQLGVSADGKWVQIDQGWVSAQYVVQRTPVVSPGPKASGTDTRRPPTGTPGKATATASATPAPAVVMKVPELGWFDRIKMTLAGNGMASFLALFGFFTGMISARKFAFWRRVINLLIFSAFGFGLAYVWKRLATQAVQPVLPAAVQQAMDIIQWMLPGGFVGGMLLGSVVYRKPRPAERGADTHCDVCGAVQRRSRTAVCPRCHRVYCNFPPWTGRSARGVMDTIAMWIAVPLGIVLTAFSVLGGVIVLGLLALPYLLVRELLPESQYPPYWKNCGRGGLCQICAAPVPSASPLLGGSSSGSSSTSEYDYGSNQDALNDDRDDDEDDEDRHSGSIWDGWLTKW